MPEDLQRAQTLLKEGGYTCVLCLGERVHCSRERGVAPLLALLDGGEDCCGFSAADKVVGKAAAMLYCLLGVRRVYAGVISDAAVRVLRRNGIEVYRDRLVEHIRNRAGTGLCPMEEATRSIDEPEAALDAIRATLARLHN